MRRRAMLQAAAVALGSLALLAGCGGTTGDQDLSGFWRGSLTLTFVGGGGTGGGLRLRLDEHDSFASGAARWDPVAKTMSISGPLTGEKASLHLVFACGTTLATTVLEGTVSGDALTFSDATGTACFEGGGTVLIDGASGALTRDSDDQPL